MKYLLMVLVITLTLVTLGCNELVGKQATVDGKVYQIVEVENATTTSTVEPEPSSYTSIRPPVTKYAIRKDVSSGAYYLINIYAIVGSAYNAPNYWAKEGNIWVYHKETRDFPLNWLIEYYPSGEEFGVELPGFNCYIQMTDGTYYAIQDRKEIIPLTADTIRIHHYYVQDKQTGRWYYSEGEKDLPHKDARVL